MTAMNHAIPKNSASPCAILVVAAGRGSRFGDPLPKQYHPMLGYPLLFHTLRALHRHPLVTRILTVIAPDDGHYHRLLEPLLPQLPKLLPPVFGGEQRQDSVQRGLAALGLADRDWVAIHDAARPLVNPAMLERLLQARDRAEAIIPALAVQDTVKTAGADRLIQGTLPRESIWLAQTPQLFRFGLIQRAHAAYRLAPTSPATDDAAMVERLGEAVLLVAGDPRNLKVTRPEDLALATWLLARQGDVDGPASAPAPSPAPLSPR